MSCTRILRPLSIVAAIAFLAAVTAADDARDVAVVAADGSVEQGAKWALVIGINGYDAQNVGKLRYAVADARRLRDALVQVAGFKPERVLLLTDAGREVAGRTEESVEPTYTTLRGQIRKFAQEHRAEDVLMLYFAGHGFHSDSTGEDYLAPIDVQPSDLEGTGIPVDWVLRNLKDSGARQAALIVDACRNAPVPAGRALGGSAMGIAQSMGVWYMASCLQGQISQEDEGLGGGVYSYYLAEGLGGPADGAAGHRRDGFVTVPEAQAYATERVQAWSRASGGRLQTPCRSQYDVTGGEMVLAVPGRYEGSPSGGIQPIATTATLHVDGTPPGAEVYIDGHLKGTVPCDATVQLDELQQRTVEVVVKFEGYTTKAARVTVQRAGRAVWRVDLAKAAPPLMSHPQPVSSGKPLERAGSRAGEEIIGPHGGKLVWVPAGSFMMGSDEYGGDTPVHRVELGGFWLGKTEVTVGEWRSVMGGVPAEYNNQGDDHPVIAVSWHDCVKFCEKVGLELPTEAQWEYAAGGPESRAYPWGTAWDAGKCCSVDNKGPGGRTFPVGSFPAGASWCGVLDMAGNVWEWCSDWYGDDYYKNSPRQNPGGPSSGERRVVRGGAWDGSAGYCRADHRYFSAPDRRSLLLGFRVSRSAL